jgi:hypothetical protein
MRRWSWWWLGVAACGGPAAVGPDGSGDSDTLNIDSDTPVDVVEDSDTPVDTPEESDTTPPDPCMVDPSVLLVGTGERAFTELSEGQDLATVHGVQGGWHYWGAVSVQNSPEFVRIRLEITDVASGIQLHSSETNARLTPASPGPWACDGSYTGLLGVLTLPEEILPDPTCNDDAPPVGQVGEWVDPTPCPTVPDVLCNRDIRMAYRVATPAGDVVGERSVSVRLQSDPELDAPCPVP